MYQLTENRETQPQGRGLTLWDQTKGLLEGELLRRRSSRSFVRAQAGFGSYRIRYLLAFVVVAASFTLAGVLTQINAAQASHCSAKQLNPGTDVDVTINADPRTSATTFCIHAGTYKISEPAMLKAGDKLVGERGTLSAVGAANKPSPVVKLVGDGAKDILRADGAGISITWVDISGAAGAGSGTGSAIAAGSAGSDFLLQYVRIHDNDSVGVSNMKDRVFDSEFFSNSKATASLGFNASAIKGITQYEAARVFVHDEQGNGL
jgi:hypothetical protein